MNWKQIATDLAEVMRKHEPPKKPEGSADRQQWIGLALTIQAEMLEHGAHAVFERELLQ